MFEVTFDWYNEARTILLIEIDPDGWTWEDAYSIVKQQVEMIKGVSHTVHTICLFKSPPRIVHSPNIFANLRKIMTTRASNQGLMIYVGTNRMFNDVMGTAGRLAGLRKLLHKYRFVITLEQALAEIKAY